MTAGTEQPRVRRERRIIERPRLMKLLDDSEARIILLLAPAGYGKTTLARQWAKTLSKVVWISCTPAHRDVAALAEAVANGIDALGGNSSRFIREYVTAQNNPQLAATRIARALGEEATAIGAQWVLIDDYHELSDSPESQQLIELFQNEASMSRFFVSTRLLPSWARPRLVVYGAIDVVDRDALAMTESESAELLGRDESKAQFARQAQGWPAVLALAASVGEVNLPESVLPSALHAFLAQELFQAAEPSLRDQLLRLALLPGFTRTSAQTYLGVDPAELLAQARDLGFVSGEEELDLHPLLREFLFERLGERADADDLVRQAVAYCLDAELFEGALWLVNRFACDDLVEPVLGIAFQPLIRTGRLGTLSAFANTMRMRPAFPPPSVDVIEAELALRDGELDLASKLARRAVGHLEHDHPLRSRTSTILGQSCLLQGVLDESLAAFTDAKATAKDERDFAEATHGVASAKIMAEEDADLAVAELRAMRHVSPAHLLRAATTGLIHRRYTAGIAAPLSIDEEERILQQVHDPRPRSSFTYHVGYALAQRAEYRAAQSWVAKLMEDVNGYDLEFARPHAVWLDASVRLGLRRFGEAERLLQSLEDMVAADRSSAHFANALLLRSRLLMQTGNPTEAARIVSQPPTEQCYPSWHAEYIATRALALACIGEEQAAREEASTAVRISRLVEVRVLSAASYAVLDAQRQEMDSAAELLAAATELGAWDPVVCALRASQDLADGLAQTPEAQTILESLYIESNDLGLARRAGFRTRATRPPDALLSPREAEVLGLIARGMRNREIAQALYISQSTTKVHVRHILEKLGVRSRAEAVARYEMFSHESKPAQEPMKRQET